MFVELHTFSVSNLTLRYAPGLFQNCVIFSVISINFQYKYNVVENKWYDFSRGSRLYCLFWVEFNAHQLTLKTTLKM